MKYKFKISILTFILFLIQGYLFSIWAEDEIKITDIRVDILNNQKTTVNINTSKPVRFLFYKIENPPRLIIDFVGTDVYSEEAERLVFTRGNLKEIQSIFYEIENNSNKPKLDYLILKFIPDVTVDVKSIKGGILLDIQKLEAVVKAKDSALKSARAKLLADQIVFSKRVMRESTKIEDKKIDISQLEKKEKEERCKATEVITLKEEPFVLSLKDKTVDTYVKPEPEDFGKTPIRKEEIKTSKKQEESSLIRKEESFDEGQVCLSVEPRSKISFNYYLLAIILNCFILASLIALIPSFSYKKEMRQKEAQLTDLNESFSNYPVYQLPQQQDALSKKGKSDKCLEKRKFARFKLPQDSESSISVDLETERLNRVVTRAKDISLGGVGIELQKNISIPNILQIGIKFPDSPEANYILSRLTWQKDKDEKVRFYGLSFMMLTDYEEEKIHRYLVENF